MSRQAALLVALLASAAGIADERQPEPPQVVIYNNTLVDLEVEVASDRYVEVLPGTSRDVQFRTSQWINFGMMAHRFELSADVEVTLRTVRVQLQAEADGKLYLVPGSAAFPASPLPSQPHGFPLEPKEVVDLT